MRYIRTKDGRIFYAREKEIVDTDELKWEAIPKGCKDYFTLNYKDEDIIKQADTIDELCDEFIVVEEYEKYREMYFYTDEDDAKAFLGYNRLRPQERLKLLIYGAIHIEDKGLIYVAKMNEKGTLELL